MEIGFGSVSGGLVVGDEDTWVMPRAWLRNVVRQRGFDPAPEFSVDTGMAAEARRQVVEQAENIERALSARSSNPELVSAAREHLAGQPSPAGAAAIAAVTSTGLPSVHAWIADHGEAFAATAVAEFMGLTFSQQWHVGRMKMTRIFLRYRTAQFHAEPAGIEGQMLIAARYALAVADDAQREAAETALAELGTTTDARQLRSFLVPSRADWFEESRRHPHRQPWWLLPSSATTYEQFLKVDREVPSSAFVLYTALYVLGPAIAPMLAADFDDAGHSANHRKLALRILAALPTDEAFTILLDRMDAKYVAPFLSSAMARFPMRAARLRTSPSP